MYCVIMAGGSGTRFWPYSREARPKQLLNIIGERSMLQMTVDRLLKMKFVKGVFIVTRADLAESIRNEIDGVPDENIITEPEGKNTAPCIGLAALHIKAQKANAVMGVFPADHLIIGHKKFENTVKTANHLAKKNKTLVTVGINPTYPATGYGYIQYISESDEDHLDAYHVKTFAEKPHLSLAKRFIDSGDFLWNGGMFIWKINTLMSAFELHMPELYQRLVQIEQRISAGENYKDIWSEIKPESIDYGLMEKVKSNLYVIKARFEWSDLGSWNSVYNQMHRHNSDNVMRGNGIVLDGKNNLVHSEDHFTAVIGLDNIVVVNTDDATLVVPRNRVEEVKRVVDWLKANKKQELL